MKDMFMDTAKVMAKGQVTIPKRIRELLNLENGDYVTFVVNKDKVEIQNYVLKKFGFKVSILYIAQGKSSKLEFLEEIENEIKEVVLTYRK